MKKSLAKIAINLNMDSIANKFMERLYATSGKGRFQILAFHKVSPDAHPFFEPIHPDVFDQYSQFLSERYRVMDLDELVERSQQGDVPDRAVAITFDDGYRDNYEYAFPILRRHGLPATIFVATGMIETGDTLWHDRVFDAFRYTTSTRARINWPDVPELSMETPADKSRSLRLALDKSREFYGRKRLDFVEVVEQALTPDRKREPEDRMLTWKQIREMHDAGIRFGSHTVTHPILSRLPKEELVKELQESMSNLTEHLRTPVHSFAYPNGQRADYNDTVKDALRKSGYSYAVTAQSGPNRAYADPFELKRGQPWQTEIELFRFNFFLQRHELANVRN